MFSTIDGFLIVCFQWAVRQMELYTPITRKSIIRFNLGALEFFLFSWALVVIFIYSTLGIPLFLCMLYVLFFVSVVIRRAELKRLGSGSCCSGAKPQEIITRFKHRISALVSNIFCAVVLLLVLPVFLLWRINLMWVILFEHCFGICWIACAVLSHEYLLCTTTLPPGEKERRKAEKEMRMLSPQVS